MTVKGFFLWYAGISRVLSHLNLEWWGTFLQRPFWTLLDFFVTILICILSLKNPYFHPLIPILGSHYYILEIIRFQIFLPQFYISSPSFTIRCGCWNINICPLWSFTPFFSPTPVGFCSSLLFFMSLFCMVLACPCETAEMGFRIECLPWYRLLKAAERGAVNFCTIF